jgi:hypothetical protein
MLMTHDEAQAVYEVLSTHVGNPDLRSWGEQYVELTRTLRKGAPLERAQKLHQLYRCNSPLPETHELMITRFEEALFGDLAKALRKKPGQLKAELHRGQPAFGKEAPYRELAPLPKFPRLGGWEADGGFWVFGGALSLGEWPGAQEEGPVHPDGSTVRLVRPALDGAWLIASRDSSIRLEDDPEPYDVKEWIAVHADHASRLDALVSELKPLGRTFVHGGQTAAADVEVAEDRGWLRDFQANEPKLRGFIVGLGGDGTAEWQGVSAGEKLCLIRTIGD